jgi:DNA replication licensing factor MCM5
MIFLVRDVREEERDRLICQHVMGVHIDHSSSSNSAYNGGSVSGQGVNANSIDGSNDPAGTTSFFDNSSEAVADHVLRIATTGYGELSVHAMKKYIQYCKIKCSPRLSEEAGDVLTSSYVRIRDDIRKQNILTSNSNRGNNQENNSSSSNAVIPITVRQLEALVRISESLAKMRMDPVVRIEDVTEALRLFQVSTMTAANTSDTNSTALSNGAAGTGSSGNALLNGGVMNRDEIDRTESFLRSRMNLPNNSSSYMNRQKLIEECIGQGYNALTVARVLYTMTGRGEIIEKNQGRLIKRIK